MEILKHGSRIHFFSAFSDSDVVPRLFFAGGDTRPSVNYLMREEKQRFGEGS